PEHTPLLSGGRGGNTRLSKGEMYHCSPWTVFTLPHKSFMCACVCVCASCVCVGVCVMKIVCVRVMSMCVCVCVCVCVMKIVCVCVMMIVCVCVCEHVCLCVSKALFPLSPPFTPHLPTPPPTSVCRGRAEF